MHAAVCSSVDQLYVDQTPDVSYSLNLSVAAELLFVVI